MNTITTATISGILATAAIAAHPYVAEFHNGAEGFSNGTLYSTAEHHVNGNGGRMKIEWDDQAVFTEIGLRTIDNEAILGNYLQDGVYGASFIVYVGSETVTSMQIRVKNSDVTSGAWYFDFGAVGPSGGYYLRDINFNPAWPDSVAMMNGWHRTGATVPAFSTVMSNVTQFDIYMPFGSAAPVYIDNVQIKAAATCPGDVTHDDFVDFEDLNILLDHWNRNVWENVDGDLNGDGYVDFEDLDQVLANWGGHCAVID